MKENKFCMFAFCIGMCLMWLPLGAAAAEVESVVAEGQTISLEWLALGFSSAWALVLQLFRLRK